MNLIAAELSRRKCLSPTFPPALSKPPDTLSDLTRRPPLYMVDSSTHVKFVIQQ